jgi:histidinol-phosphate/aromatic aminotransferase/cobyric acid decarboxylase-like protein
LILDELSELGLSESAVLDLSVNVNPYGACPELLEAIRDAPLERYPDSTALPARRALAASLDVPVERIVLAHGAAELLWSVARARLAPASTLLVIEPAFSELRRAAAVMGARVLEHRLLPECDFAFDLAALDALLARERPELVYVCSPANPTGLSAPLAPLVELAERYPATCWLVDLSFAELSAEPPQAPLAAERNIVWLRSLTKECAVPGLRVGFAVMPASLARTLEQSRPPWSVSAPAQAAAVAATGAASRRFVARSRALWLRDRARLEAELTRLGLRFHPSDTVYSLVDLGGRAATSFRRRLLERHAISIRDATSFGLPGHVRIAACPQTSLLRLTRALTQELAT